MEAIGTLAGGIAHDFNNVLNVIIGFSEIIQMSLKKDDPLRDSLNEILSAADRATQLTRSLLAFSRKQIMELKEVDLNEIVRGVKKMLARIIGEDIELSTDLADADLTVMADYSQIEQVLMNLATNARGAMPAGGKLLIETKRFELDQDFIYAHGFGQPGTYALLSVTDTGTGIDDETKEKIFEPFFTTKELGEGTGLGLSMAYGIIKQHNGYVNVYSKPGEGTIFKIYLPLIGRSAPEAPDTTTPPSVQGGTETVLIAEDYEAVRTLTSNMLRQFGYTVIESKDGEDAVRQFATHQDKIDLLLFDVIMPKKNGKEAYEEIRMMKPGIKALFMSGYTADLIHTTGILDEGLNFISKPVSLNVLLRRVREVLDN
jgi:CheY-like chemotaxis protein